ncbi:TPA: DUF1525 domain-containing protein [Photobacterium damselae]
MYKNHAKYILGLVSVLASLVPVSASTKPLDPQTVEVCVTHSQVRTVVDVNPKAHGLSVYVVDNIKELEKQVTDFLPKYDKSKYRSQDEYVSVVRNKLTEWNTEHKDNIKQSWSGIYTCLNDNINKTPAVIIDQSFVVYGDTVSNSVRKWRAHINRAKRNTKEY